MQSILLGVIGFSHLITGPHAVQAFVTTRRSRGGFGKPVISGPIFSKGYNLPTEWKEMCFSQSMQPLIVHGFFHYADYVRMFKSQHSSNALAYPILKSMQLSSDNQAVVRLIVSVEAEQVMGCNWCHLWCKLCVCLEDNVSQDRLWLFWRCHCC